MVTPAQRAEIRRLHDGEHWKLGAIAAELGLHRETVRAAVERESGAGRPGVCRPSALDPTLPFIRTLAQYPRLRATRIHEWSDSAATQARSSNSDASSLLLRMEGAGVYWKALFEALEDAGIRAQLFPCGAQMHGWETR